MIGIMKPIIGLIVEPTKDIASPILLILIAIKHDTVHIINVAYKFYLNVMPSSLKNSSSKVSLQGKT
jgi:hypothetical protein